MRFLIDECLHTSLVTVAHDAGYGCDHVNFLGLGSYKDWQLLVEIRRCEYTFVTNNLRDFIALYRRETLHAGLMIIIPNAPPDKRDLFGAAVSHIGGRDLANTLLEVSVVGGVASCREYPYPPR